jgi:hypothetical protein
MNQTSLTKDSKRFRDSQEESVNRFESLGDHMARSMGLVREGVRRKPPMK